MMFEVFAIVGAVLGAASLLLHIVAPMTKTTMDDKLRDGVDFVKDKVLPMAEPLMPKEKAVAGFEPKADPMARVRDHRTGK